MGEYINKYANSAAIQSAVDGGELIKPYVALDESTGLIDWNSKKADYSKMYFTVEALSDGDFILRRSRSGMAYSVNNGEWQTITVNPTTLALSTGDKVRFKLSNSNADGEDMFSGNTIQFNVYGNIMSLKYGDNFSEHRDNSISCSSMFKNCTGLTDASNLILPTVSGYYSYNAMFRGCTSLIQAPELPATTLASSCYLQMFYACSDLTTAPQLPATTLASNCYNSMFGNCRSLTTAPELPATTLANNCYNGMFYGCTNLNYIKCLATDISASGCTNGWVNNVASSGTFVTPSSTAWSTGNSGIPTGWTRVDA